MADVPQVTKLQTVASGKTYNQLQTQYNPPAKPVAPTTMEAKHPENRMSGERFKEVIVRAKTPTLFTISSNAIKPLISNFDKWQEFKDGAAEWLSTKYAPLLIESNPLIQLEKQMLKVAVNDMLPQGASVQDRVELMGDFVGLAPLPFAKLGVVAKFGMAKLGMFGGITKDATKVGEKVADVIIEAKNVVNNKFPTATSQELIPTEDISRNKKQFRMFLDEVKKNGITEPIKYVEYEGEKYVVDGHHSLRAARILGIDNLPVQEVNLPFRGYQDVTDLLGKLGRW